MKMLKNPCGVCKKGVGSGSIFCKGPCGYWYHKRCLLHMTDSQFREICKEGNQHTWKCLDCTKTSNNEEINSLEEVKSKISSLSMNTNEELELSLIAAEAGNSLLNEDEKLNQGFHFIKSSKTEYQVVLEDELKSCQNQLNMLKTKEIKTSLKSVETIAILEDRLKKSEEFGRNLVLQFDKERLDYENNKNELVQKKSQLESQVSELKNKLSTINRQTESAVVSKLLKSDDAAWSRARWLDDTILQSYFHSFNQDPTNKNSSVLLLGPLSIQILKHCCKEDVKAEMDNLKIKDFKYVLCCLSDSSDPMADDSGSHWSLLTLDNTRKVAYHFDSSSGLNKLSALALMKNINFNDALIEIPCPQQQNSFECGINVLVNTKIVIESYCKNTIFQNLSLEDWYKSYMLGSMDQYDNTDTNLPSNVMIGKTYYTKEVKATDPKGVLQPEITPDRITTKPVKGVNKWLEVWKKKKKLKKSTECDSKSANLSVDRYSIVLQNSFTPLMETPEALDTTETPDVNFQAKPIRSQSGHKLNKTKQKVSFHRNTNIFKVTEINKKAPSKHKIATTTPGKVTSVDVMDKKTKHLYNISKKPTLYITGDSHARNYAELLTPLLPHYNITSTYYPGAPMVYILNQLEKRKLDFRKEDCVLLIGGTNRTDPHHQEQVYAKLHTIINTFNAEIILTELPYLYQQPYNGRKFFEIEQCNSELWALSLEANTKFFLFNHKLHQKEHYSKNGLHLNLTGKSIVCQCILSWMKTPQCPKLQQFCSSTSITNKLLKDNLPEQQQIHMSQVNVNSEKILVVEADMATVIKNLNKQDFTALAHCISADIYSEKNMSEGVAVVFKEFFGRPTSSDVVQPHLAYQEIKGEFGVYSLITKEEYFHKPSKVNYNKAFQSLAEDFKNRNYKCLVCSPMGCTRDKIKLELFATNIIKFQENTGAQVKIVVCKEESNIRNLRRGLSHDDFVRRLRLLTRPATRQSGNSTELHHLIDIQHINDSTAHNQSDSSTEHLRDDSPTYQPHQSSEMFVSSVAGEASYLPHLPTLAPGNLSYLEAVVLGKKSASVSEKTSDFCKQLTGGPNDNHIEDLGNRLPFLELIEQRKIHR